MRKTGTSVLLTAFVASSGVSTVRAAETEQDRWNLADIYPSPEAWREAKDAVKASLSKIDAHKGRVAESVESLKACLDTVFSILKEVQRVSAYASMLSDEDTRVDRHAQMREEADLLWSAFSERISFLKPELLAVGADKSHSFVAREPGLSPAHASVEPPRSRQSSGRAPSAAALAASRG